jgi:ABC-type polysaccharide/polyol phosphate export permease
MNVDYQARAFPIAIGRTPLRATRIDFPAEPHRQALRDIIDASRNWMLWGYLGWHDIRQRYRRSKLGPLWITSTVAANVAAIGLVFGALFGQEMHVFLPYLSAGLILWTFLAALLLEGCMAFISEERLIKQSNMPFFMHVLRMIWRNLIILAHNLLIFVAVCVLFSVKPRFTTFYLLPASALFLLNMTWIALLLAVVSARFRDIQPIIASLLQVLYLATPIVWQTRMLPKLHLLYLGNPLYHLINLVRQPLLGESPELASWVVCALLAIVGPAVTFVVFARYRPRIPYWV